MTFSVSLGSNLILLHFRVDDIEPNVIYTIRTNLGNIVDEVFRDLENILVS